MNLIEGYVNAAAENLTKDTREYARKEMIANIEGMLPENPTEEDVRKVLDKLGEPKKFSEKYRGAKRYLIGPKLYDSYFAVLKLVIGIVTTVFVCLTFVRWAINPPVNGELAQMSIKFFTDMLIAVWEGILQAALWVTVVFAVLERMGINEKEIPFAKKTWSTDNLEKLQVSKRRRISRVETAFSMFFTVFFTGLICFQPQLIAMYVKGANGVTQVTPLFELGRLHLYVPAIIILAVIQLAIFICKFISMQWTISIAIVHTVYNAAFCMLIIVMLSDKSLFNYEFLSKVAGYTKGSLSQITFILDRGTWIFAAVFIVICFWDSAAAFIKCRK